MLITTDDWPDSNAVIGALLGTQNGREVEIVNTFELAMESDKKTIDHGFFTSRREQCKFGQDSWLWDALTCHWIDKQVFPSLEFIGWYTVAPQPTARHIALHEQVRFSFIRCIS